VTKIGLFGMVVLTLCTAVVLAQTGGGGRGGGILIRHQAPTDRALDFPLATLQAEFADMIAQKRMTTRLLEGGAYSMNARYLVGSEAAQVHKSIIELYFVRDGSAGLYLQPAHLLEAAVAASPSTMWSTRSMPMTTPAATSRRVSS
jgi:hypothetical protein